MEEFPNDNNDTQNANLVRRSIENIRAVLTEKNIQDVKISDITSVAKISRSKFFSFFGGMNTLLELVLTEELVRSYEQIALSIKNQEEKKNLEVELSLLRIIYIRKNHILYNYYKVSELLPSRYDELKEALTIKEQNLQSDILKEHGVEPNGLKWKNAFSVY
jgi:AcrR family transcriptional regulator